MTDRDALKRIAELIAPRVSTRFVDGEPLADEIESVLGEAGVHLFDGRNGVEVRDQRAKTDAEELGKLTD